MDIEYKQETEFLILTIITFFNIPHNSLQHLQFLKENLPLKMVVQHHEQSPE